MSDTLHRVLEAVETEIPKPIKAVEMQFAPLLERAPGLTREAIMSVFETAAQRAELAGEELMKLATARVADARAAAAHLRTVGAEHAKSIEQVATYALNSALTFRQHLDTTASIAAGGEAVTIGPLNIVDNPTAGVRAS